MTLPTTCTGDVTQHTFSAELRSEGVSLSMFFEAAAFSVSGGGALQHSGFSPGERWSNFKDCKDLLHAAAGLPRFLTMLQACGNCMLRFVREFVTEKAVLNLTGKSDQCLPWAALGLEFSHACQQEALAKHNDTFVLPEAAPFVWSQTLGMGGDAFVC